MEHIIKNKDLKVEGLILKLMQLKVYTDFPQNIKWRFSQFNKSVYISWNEMYFCKMYIIFSFLVIIWIHIFSSVQFNSVAQSCPTLCDPKNHSTPGLPVHHKSQSLLKLMPIKSVMPSSHLILCHPLLLLPPIPPSIRVFSNESTLRMRWPKYRSFSFSISPSNEHPGLISFRMSWLDLLAVQGTLKSLLQHHSSKASILLCSAFFTIQLSHPYMTTEKP